MNSLIILGSTGSIGAQALDVEKLSLKVEALTANSDAKNLRNRQGNSNPALPPSRTKKRQRSLK